MWDFHGHRGALAEFKDGDMPAGLVKWGCLTICSEPAGHPGELVVYILVQVQEKTNVPAHK